MSNMPINIKEHITAGPCKLVCARADNLWYKTALGFEFPVPFSDMGDATFEAEEKGKMLIRYIRKHNELITAARQQQNVA
jgi:hypothetical protein